MTPALTAESLLPRDFFDRPVEEV
ncbi:MAG: hypothetical protein JWO67_2780, partial [Streptosporangiaceae bacterium]|nr:hypothetical protein [Streptosporangiaceae bacterium]